MYCSLELSGGKVVVPVAGVLLGCLSHLGSFSHPLEEGGSSVGPPLVVLVVFGVEATVLFLVVLVLWWGELLFLDFVVILSVSSRLIPS